MRFLRISIVFLLLAISQISPAHSSENYLVIGIDVSGSMKGEALEAVLSTTERIVNSLGSERTLEVYTFTRSPKKLEYPYSLASITSGGYTALYDSIWSLSQRARTLDAPLIVLTDGKDSKSLISPDEILVRLNNYPESINFIAYNPTFENEAILKSFSLKTKGSFYTVSQSDKLIQILRETVRKVSVERNNSSNNIVIALSILTGLIAMALLRLLLQSRKASSFIDSWSNFLEEYELEPKDLSKTQGTNSLGVIERVVGDTSVIAPQITDKTKRESILLLSFIALISILVFSGLSIIGAIPLSIILIALFLKSLVRFEAKNSRLRFERDLPASLRLIASSLTAGLSFLQALDNFSKEGNSQVALEFRRALSEIQMGAPVERALGDIAERMQSEDLRWVVFAFSVQREVGGGLAKILQTSAEAIDARATLRQEIRTLATEGRISSYVLILLPPGIFLFLFVTHRQLISLFWKESIGQVLLLAVFALMSIAWFWIRRLVNLTS